jgi:hypothetical protein
MQQARAERAPRVERVERLQNLQLLAIAVVAVRETEVQLPAAAPHVRVRPVEDPLVAIDGGAARELQRLAATEEVRVLQLETRSTFPAAQLEGRAGIQRPDVARVYRDVNRVVVEAHGANLGVEQIAHVAQRSLAFIEHVPRIQITRSKQQARLDRRRARVHVQPVRDPVERLVLFGNRQVEHVADVILDAADAGAALFELGVTRHGRVAILRERALCREQAHGDNGGQESQGSRTLDPVVRRASRSRCASAAFASG